MNPVKTSNGERKSPLIILVTVVIVAAAVFAFTWVGINESRSDSLHLLVQQGRAFMGALAEATENVIRAEAIYDDFIQRRYSEIVRELEARGLESMNEDDLARVAVAHGLDAVHIFNMDTSLARAGIVLGPISPPPAFVVEEVGHLITSPEIRFVLLLDDGDRPGDARHYYLEITNDLSHIVVLVIDAEYYVDALEQTQVGFVAQNMAQQQGVEYIIYQSKDGIVFTSRFIGQLLSIETDPFLQVAMESDSISHRVFEFEGERVLELVRPFATSQYPFGVLRVGMSLDKYYSVMRGYDIQMIGLATILTVMLLVAILYVGSRRKRLRIAEQYSRIKIITDQIFDQMRIGVAVVDRAGVVCLANESCGEILGLAQPVDRPWAEIIGNRSSKMLDLAREDRPAGETEVRLDVDGQRRWLLVATSPLNVEPYGVVMVLYNITVVRDLERKSARKERLSELGDLAAGVAHEIRNPLNAISIAAQRLAAEFEVTNNEDDFTAFTKQIRSETKRLNEIITRFLALAREGGSNTVRLKLDDWLAETANFLRMEAKELGIEIDVTADPDSIVEVEPDRLRQVFVNLFNNTKEALNGDNGRVAIEAKRRDNTVVLIFADNGPGIAEDQRDKVFTPYFTTKEAGTGLGLPTVHRIVSEMGGDISYTDHPLRGAAFRIELPTAR